MKRLLLVLSLAATITAASALPAFAAGWDPAMGCREGDRLISLDGTTADPADENRDLAVCEDDEGGRYDNRPEKVQLDENQDLKA